MGFFNHCPTELALEIVGHLTDPVDLGNFSMTCSCIDAIVDPILQHRYGAFIVGDPNLYYHDIQRGKVSKDMKFAAIEKKTEFRKDPLAQNKDLCKYLRALTKCKRLTKYPRFAGLNLQAPGDDDWDYDIGWMTPIRPGFLSQNGENSLRSSPAFLGLSETLQSSWISSIRSGHAYDLIELILLLCPNLEVLDLTHTNLKRAPRFSIRGPNFERSFRRLRKVTVRCHVMAEPYHNSLKFLQPLFFVPSVKEVRLDYMTFDALQPPSEASSANTRFSNVEVLDMHCLGKQSGFLQTLLGYMPKLREFCYCYDRKSPYLDIGMLNTALESVKASLETLQIYNPLALIRYERAASMLAHSTNSTGLYLKIPILLLCCTMPNFFYTAIKKYKNFIINSAILV